MLPLEPTLAAALQAQFNQERSNRDAYEDLAAGFMLMGLEGFTAWAEYQAKEEAWHAARFATYLTDTRGVKAELRDTPAQAFNFLTPQTAYQYAADLEAKNTALIIDLFGVAEDAEDEAACQFIRWFIVEQEKSEAEFKNWLAQLTLIDWDGAGTLAYDAALLKKYGE